jgi:hypothetical protein
MIKWLKNQGLSKLAFGFAAIGGFVLTGWSTLTISALAIFIYVNFTAILNVSGVSKWWTEFWAKTNS